VPRRVATTDELIATIAAASAGRTRPLVIALDGRGGSGKSTLAATLGSAFDGVVIDGDDFYAGGAHVDWDAMAPAPRADRCIDWRRQRAVLETLIGGRTARWQPYDWHVDDGRCTADWQEATPRGVVILEGTFSARPELADLLDLRVRLDVSPEVQRARFVAREGEDDWRAWKHTWMDAEDHYFAHVVPDAAFDVIVQG
jgi:uridine kinase